MIKISKCFPLDVVCLTSLDDSIWNLISRRTSERQWLAWKGVLSDFAQNTGQLSNNRNMYLNKVSLFLFKRFLGDGADWKCRHQVGHLLDFVLRIFLECVEDWISWKWCGKNLRACPMDTVHSCVIETTKLANWFGIIEFHFLLFSKNPHFVFKRRSPSF